MTKLYALECLFLAMILTSLPVSAATFENDVVRVEFGKSAGVDSWFSKRYQEEFFGVDVAHDVKDVIWTPAGIHFGYLPSHVTRAATGPNVEVTRTSSESSWRVVAEDPNGAVLPKGIQATMVWSFSNRYSARLDLVVQNLTDDTVKLEGPDRGPVMLYAFPLFRDDIYRTEALAMTKDGDVVQQSPSDSTVTTLDDGTRWVGMRNQYYGFGLREQTTNGRYATTSIKTIVKHEDGNKKITVPLVAWKLVWPALRARERLEATFDVYLGPKQDSELAGTPFEKMFDTWSGVTGPIGRLMFALLQQLQLLTGSYGYAILLLTFLVKVVLHPINKKQMVAMKKMQQLQPKMQEIKEKYSNDQQRQNAELQKLFIEHEVNPLGGCLPILVQIPIFIALYTCLSAAIELKRVPFAWMPDLSQPDPLHVLPILFCVSIYYSSQANSTGDPNQAMMMKMMPAFMLFIFWNMASGVMLYIAGQSLFSMVEQQYNKMGLADGPAATVTPEPTTSSRKKSKRKE